MKRRDFILSISALSALAACGSPQGSGNFQLPQPQDGHGLLVIYRPGSAIGSGLRFPLTVDGMSVGNLSNGAVITQSVSPGEHVVQTSAPSVDGTSGVTVRVGAGETAFVKGEAVLGWPTYRPRLVIVPNSQGQAEMARM
jgi:hypothetical protein